MDRVVAAATEAEGMAIWRTTVPRPRTLDEFSRFVLCGSLAAVYNSEFVETLAFNNTTEAILEAVATRLQLVSWRVETADELGAFLKGQAPANLGYDHGVGLVMLSLALGRCDLVNALLDAGAEPRTKILKTLAYQFKPELYPVVDRLLRYVPMTVGAAAYIINHRTLFDYAYPFIPSTLVHADRIAPHRWPLLLEYGYSLSDPRALIKILAREYIRGLAYRPEDLRFLLDRCTDVYSIYNTAKSVQLHWFLFNEALPSAPLGLEQIFQVVAEGRAMPDGQYRAETRLVLNSNLTEELKCYLLCAMVAAGAQPAILGAFKRSYGIPSGIRAAIGRSSNRVSGAQRVSQAFFLTISNTNLTHNGLQQGNRQLWSVTVRLDAASPHHGGCFGRLL
jgi:hypothetical protein